MKRNKMQKGITLVALIITIIVLLILAVVAIRSVTGDGIIAHAKNARDDTIEAQENEKATLQSLLGNIEKNTGDKPLYSIGILSDVHINVLNDSKDNNSQNDFKNALQFFNSYGCVATCISGDITNNGTDEEFAKYIELRDLYKGNMKVYASTGNHEAASSRTYTSTITDTQCIAHNIYNKIGNHYFYYVENGKYTYWDISPSNYTVDTAKNVTIQDSSIVLPEGDVYIFLGILGDANGSIFWNEAFQWIYETLEANKNKRCFVFEHARPELASSFSNGSITDDIYKSYVSGNPTGAYKKPLWGQATNNGEVGLRAKTFEHLLSHYTNCIWFHGHTHASADTSEYSTAPGRNVALVDSHFGNAYSAYAPESCVNNTKWTWSVHVPSAAEPRKVSGINKDGSEGIVMDVYEDRIVLKYINFAETTDDGIVYINRLYNESIYELDTSLDEISTYVPTYVNIGSSKAYLVKVK